MAKNKDRDDLIPEEALDGGAPTPDAADGAADGAADEATDGVDDAAADEEADGAADAADGAEAPGDTAAGTPPAKSGKFDRLTQDEGDVRKLTGMYKNWFLDYASYVILERAVPHVEDGLKPVQRRILHAMKVVDDGRYNKVANLVGQTMQYHPHGDASIKDALVQLGQKDLLIDCQGNWGNILTGDEAAAGRYIEARLSKFALDVVFNKKTTEWMLSYDGRKEGAGDASDQVSAAAGAGLGRYRRGAGVEDPAAQLQRADQCGDRTPAGARVPALPGLPDGGHGGREPL